MKYEEILDFTTTKGTSGPVALTIRIVDPEEAIQVAETLWNEAKHALKNGGKCVGAIPLFGEIVRKRKAA